MKAKSSSGAVSIASAVVLIAGLIFSSATAVSAKGGGSNFMQSDGYQRALKQSRERYQHSYQQPVVVYPARPHHRRHWRHRYH